MEELDDVKEGWNKDENKNMKEMKEEKGEE